MRKAQGFTLIELLISITILSFISLGIYRSTAQSFSIRENLERDNDFYNSIRAALDVIGRDLIHFYNPQAAAMPGDSGKNIYDDPTNPDARNQTPPPPGFPLNEGMAFWSVPINPSGMRYSRFTGSETEISFVSTSHIRLYRDTAECEIVKIKYFLEDAKTKANGKILFKTEDADFFNDPNSSDTEIRYPLLSHVMGLKFRYLDARKDVWLTKWDSASVDFKNVYPSVVEVSLEVAGPDLRNQNASFKIYQHFRPEMAL
jgi:prepilin-type N-terminal cleavage/methylation domain-containing protein